MENQQSTRTKKVTDNSEYRGVSSCGPFSFVVGFQKDSTQSFRGGPRCNASDTSGEPEGTLERFEVLRFHALVGTGQHDAVKENLPSAVRSADQHLLRARPQRVEEIAVAEHSQLLHHQPNSDQRQVEIEFEKGQGSSSEARGRQRVRACRAQTKGIEAFTSQIPPPEQERHRRQSIEGEESFHRVR